MIVLCLCYLSGVIQHNNNNNNRHYETAYLQNRRISAVSFGLLVLLVRSADLSQFFFARVLTVFSCLKKHFMLFRVSTPVSAIRPWRVTLEYVCVFVPTAYCPTCIHREL